MKLSDISDEAQKTRPVFIVGTKRSGTSILYRTLQKHSLFQPKEIDLTESAIFSSATRAYTYSPEYPWQLINYMLQDQTVYTRFLQIINPIQQSQKRLSTGKIMQRIVRRQKSLADRWWFLMQGHMVVRAFLYFAQEARGCERLVEKTPNHFRFIPQMMHTFPGAKIICMLRHPVDVYSSRVRRGQMAEPYNGDLLVSPDEFINKYQQFVANIVKQQAKYKGAIYLLRYESFTSQPVNEFQAVCHFLDVPFEESAVIEKEPDLERWLPDPLLWGPIVPKTKKWQDFVSEEAAAYIEGELEPVLDLFGYEPYAA